MKKYTYIWKKNKCQFTGSKMAESKNALEAHIASLGGTLYNILHEEDLPENLPDVSDTTTLESLPPAPSVEEPTPLAPMPASTPQSPLKKQWQKIMAYQEPPFLVTLLGWTTMIGSTILALLIIIIGIMGLFSNMSIHINGQEARGLSGILYQILGLVLWLIFPAILFFSGILILTFPGIGLFVLFSVCCTHSLFLIVAMLLGFPVIWGLLLLLIPTTFALYTLQPLKSILSDLPPLSTETNAT